MKKKFFVVALALVLLAGAVAVGVLVMHRDSLAANHTVKVVDINSQEGIPDMYVQIWVVEEINGEIITWDFYDDVTDANGTFVINDVPPSTATFWVAFASEDDIFDAFLEPIGDTFVSVFYNNEGYTHIFWVQEQE